MVSIVFSDHLQNMYCEEWEQQIFGLYWIMKSILLKRFNLSSGRSYGSAVDWMDSTPEEVALWARMAAAPNEWAEAVLPLRMMSSAKTAFR